MNLREACFHYADREGNNELSAEGSITVDLDDGTIAVSVLQGDMTGDSYTAYVPNHRADILKLIDALINVLDLTMDWPKGYDGFSYNQASAFATTEVAEGAINEGMETGVIKWH